MEISFIHTQMLVHLHVNKTNFHMKGFALGLALKQRRKATRKKPIILYIRKLNNVLAYCDLVLRERVSDRVGSAVPTS